MINFKLKLALAAATSAVVMLGGATASSAAELTLSPNQPTQAGAISVETDGMYLVRLADPAIATYEGSISGLAATSAKATGKKRLDTKSNAAQKYKKHLEKQQAKALDVASQKFGRTLDTAYRYQYAVNGFAVVMTAAEAKTMRSMDGVVSVQREKMESITTDRGPNWIGAPSVWNNNPAGSQGEGVVIAVLDTGINYDHPSFADIGGDGYDHTNPLGSGNYVPGSYCDTADPGFCNDKLIGAWSFVNEAVTPNDSDGHGSHTASTAAGNVVANAELVAPTTSAYFNISGVAPHANIIAYDVCVDGCPGAALVAAINQVLIDAGNLPNGIAALNYSISGGGDPYNDTVELGFLAAVEAGVYVAASAGNSGPTASTVAHLGPWVSTTAASTHDRSIVNSLIDIDSAGGSTPDIIGKGFTAGYGPAVIINSADLEGTYPGATLCGTGPDDGDTSPFPANTFNGEIVACTRGTYGRVEKGANVLAAGAGGYVLMDNGAGLVGDAHVLPGVHISAADGATLSAWLAANAGNNPMASIAGYEMDIHADNGDIMGGFSSRGPQLAFDVLKPDVTAPGVDIMGAEADGQGLGFPEYQIISGTSMSSPHNAGAGALLTAMRPDLTAQEIKSAIMLSSTTANTVKEDGITPTDAFDLGAGRIDLNSAKNAGLVLSETIANFNAANPDLGGDPSTLNLASMMNSSCVGTCSWTRTVTNKEVSTSHWNVTTTSPAGVMLDSEVSPAANSNSNNLKLKKGKSATITVTADTSLAEEGWHFGTVDLNRNTGNAPDLHMPIAVYASRASNPELFTKSVDMDTASAGDTLTYELSVTNGPVTGPITVTDEVPAGTTFVAGSETEVVSFGSTSSAWSYDAGTNSMSWTGELDAGGLHVAPAPLYGYFPLASIGVLPRAKTCNGDCDDGGFVFNLPAFTYNGATYTQMIWSINGTLEAGTSSGVFSSFSNQSLPDANQPNNILAPFWRDLNLNAGGQLYIAVLNDAVPSQWTVFEWAAVPHFGTADTVTMQVWVGNNGTPSEGEIYFVYGNMTNPGAGGTVGAENSDGTNGVNYFYNGAGTAPGNGTQLLVSTLQGGSATLGFQVEASCDSASVVNRGELSSSAGDEAAIAVTQCQ